MNYVPKNEFNRRMFMSGYTPEEIDKVRQTVNIGNQKEVKYDIKITDIVPCRCKDSIECYPCYLYSGMGCSAEK